MNSLVGIFNCWFIDKVLVVRLFCCFNFSTVVLYFFAIEYKVSPDFTVYVVNVVGISIISVSGNRSTWPMVSVLLVRLFSFFKISTVVLFWVAMRYSVSPALTV